LVVGRWSLFIGVAWWLAVKAFLSVFFGGGGEYGGLVRENVKICYQMCEKSPFGSINCR
jgi:hypothetical protein